MKRYKCRKCHRHFPTDDYAKTFGYLCINCHAKKIGCSINIVEVRNEV